MEAYVKNTTAKIHDMIQQTPVDSPITSRILDILEVMNEVIQAIASVNNQLDTK